MCILNFVVSGFQTHQRRELILQKPRPRVQVNETQVRLHIIFGILLVRQTTEKSQQWVSQPNRFRDISIPGIGAGDLHRTEELGDIYKRGHILHVALDSRFLETQSIYLLERTE